MSDTEKITGRSGILHHANSLNSEKLHNALWPYRQLRLLANESLRVMVMLMSSLRSHLQEMTVSSVIFCVAVCHIFKYQSKFKMLGVVESSVTKADSCPLFGWPFSRIVVE